MISTRRAWLRCVLLFFAAALCFLDRQVLSVLAPKITRRKCDRRIGEDSGDPVRKVSDVG